MWNKKRVIIIVSLILILGLGLIPSCGKAGGGVAAEGKIPITIGAGSVGGTWFPKMTALMIVLNEQIPELVCTVVPGNSIVNTRAMGKSEVDISMAYVSSVVDAWDAREPFETKIRNIGAMGQMPYTPYHFIVLADSDIYSIEDLADKNLSVGTSGSGTNQCVMRVLAEVGITEESVKAAGGEVNYLGYGDGAMALRDRVVDMTISDGMPPAPRIMELEATLPIRVLPLSPELSQAMFDKYGYAQWLLAGGVYKGTPEDTMICGSPQIMAARMELSEDLVYKMTKALYENTDRLTEIYSAFADLDPETGAENMPIPFHPGAERYWKEQGKL